MRDEFSQKIDQIRTVLAQVYASAATVIRDQQRAIWITVEVSRQLAALLGMLFAGLVSTGITRPVRRGCFRGRGMSRRASSIERSMSSRATKSANCQRRSIAWSINCDTRSSSGRRSADTSTRASSKACIDQQAVAATEGRRRVMTVMFCRHEGIHRAERRHDPTRAGQGDKSLSLDHVGADPGAARHHRRDDAIGDAHHGLLGPAFSSIKPMRRASPALPPLT